MVLRWVLAVWLIVFVFNAWFFALKEYKLTGPFMGWALIACVVFAILILSFTFVFPIGRSFGSLFENIFNPGERFSKAPLSYVLARFYRDQHRFEESTFQYEQIIHNYPKERVAYEELLAMAECNGDTRIYRRYERRYKRRFGGLPADFAPDQDASKSAG